MLKTPFEFKNKPFVVQWVLLCSCAPNSTILSKLNLLHSRIEDVYCKSFEVKLSKIEMPPHCFWCVRVLTNSQRVCCFVHWLRAALPFLKAITHIQILLSISRSLKIVTVFLLATVCLTVNLIFSFSGMKWNSNRHWNVVEPMLNFSQNMMH